MYTISIYNHGEELNLPVYGAEAAWEYYKEMVSALEPWDIKIYLVDATTGEVVAYNED